jgi:hypothetical protein
VVELALVHVLRHPSEEITPEVVHRVRHTRTFVDAGATEHFVVRYEEHLGKKGEALASGVLEMCEADFMTVKGWFGGIVPNRLPFRCFVAHGQFGAFHATCADTELHLAAFDEKNVELVEMVNMAEVVEVFSAHQKAGWNCGASNGEGLSRVLAAELHPSQLDGFATAAAWLNSKRHNFIDRNEDTDLNPVSTGCAALFLNYLHHQLRYPWEAIVTHGQPTLSETYHALSRRSSDVWNDFSTLINMHFPPGERAKVTTDNVFPL